ncbi:MAG TPA: hypothetical protein VFA34_14660 [Actinomycetota bacterium]|jgi:hypothetical protein|nr:hypothetical protein [Actinomycetota bacterium]
MSRIEAIARGLLVIGAIAGVVTVVTLLAQRIIGGADAPEVAELGPLLGEGDVLHDAERADLATNERPARSVLLSVPAAINQKEAWSSMLRVLKASGWITSPNGGAVPREGSVCLVVSTPTDWLGDRGNADYKEEFERKLSEESTIAVLVDMFFCSKPRE